MFHACDRTGNRMQAGELVTALADGDEIEPDAVLDTPEAVAHWVASRFRLALGIADDAELDLDEAMRSWRSLAELRQPIAVPVDDRVLVVVPRPIPVKIAVAAVATPAS